MSDKYRRQLAAVESEMRSTLDRAKSITGKASDEGRALTDEEKAELKAQLKAVDVLKEKQDEIQGAIDVNERVESLGRTIKVEEPAPVESKIWTPGEAFTKSDGYLRAKADGFSGRWSTGPIEVKATLTTVASPIIQPDVQAGILPELFERLTVAGLMASGSTDSNTVRYIQETTNSANAAASVAEGGDKPESTLDFEEVDEPVRKIATFLPVSDEMLDDAAQIESYVNSRLALFVRIEEEDQLLNGAAAGSDLDGLLNRIPVGNQDLISAAASEHADDIYTAITKVRESFLEPDGIVIHPNDWADIMLAKDGNERYYGNGPFQAGPDTLWGLRVVVTSAMTEGTALVGAFQAGAQVFRKGGLSVEASNSHSDFFTKNLVAIRAEERLALAVYRPAAFATADLLAT